MRSMGGGDQIPSSSKAADISPFCQKLSSGGSAVAQLRKKGFTWALYAAEDQKHQRECSAVPQPVRHHGGQQAFCALENKRKYPTQAQQWEHGAGIQMHGGK